jgi:hypothetical protein
METAVSAESTLEAATRARDVAQHAVKAALEASGVALEENATADSALQAAAESATKARDAFHDAEVKSHEA